MCSRGCEERGTERERERKKEKGKKIGQQSGRRSGCNAATCRWERGLISGLLCAGRLIRPLRGSRDHFNCRGHFEAVLQRAPVEIWAFRVVLDSPGRHKNVHFDRLTSLHFVFLPKRSENLHFQFNWASVSNLSRHISL